MIPALSDLQGLRIAAARPAVHQPVFMVDPARPPARQFAAERFGLAGAVERSTSTFLDQRVRPWIVVMEYRIPGANLNGKPRADAQRARPAP